MSGRSSLHFQFSPFTVPGRFMRRLAAEPEQVLRGDDDELVLDCEDVLQERPVLALAAACGRRRAAADARVPSAATSSASVSESWVEV